MTPGRIQGCCLILACLLAIAAQAQLAFSEITEAAGIDHHYLGVNEMGAGAAFFDMDNDGDEDLWISGGLKQDALYENDGYGHFTNIADEAGLVITNQIVTTGVITGDIDNDGYRDVLLLTHIGFPNILLKNNGDRTFSDYTYFSELGQFKAYNLAAALGDLNLDGYLDIYTAHYIEKNKLNYNSTQDTVLGFQHDCHANRLYINQGISENGEASWAFNELAEDWGVANQGCALATVFSDFDGDHDPDLMVANDFGAWISPNALYENRLAGTALEDVSEYSGMDVGIYGMGIAIGDYDNDLDLDYYVTNLGENVLLQNQGDGTFTQPTKEAGITDTYLSDSLYATGWGTAFMDLDNDTDLDLYVVNGYVPAAPFIDNGKANPNRLFENDGSGAFATVEAPIIESPMRGRGLAYADIDRDGDLDFLVTNVNRQATSDTIQKVQLFRNELNNSNNWLDIKLEGSQNNKDGFGSKIYIVVAGRKYLQEFNGGFGTHASQHSSIAHFGLGQANIVDSIIVIWPGGMQQTTTNLASNQLITIVEESIVSSHQNLLANQDIQLSCFPNPFSDQIRLQYTIAHTSAVNIKIFDSLGRLTFNHFQEKQTAGEHSLSWTAPFPGTYFVALHTDFNYLHDTIISN